MAHANTRAGLSSPAYGQRLTGMKVFPCCGVCVDAPALDGFKRMKVPINRTPYKVLCLRLCVSVLSSDANGYCSTTVVLHLVYPSQRDITCRVRMPPPPPPPPMPPHAFHHSPSLPISLKTKEQTSRCCSRMAGGAIAPPRVGFGGEPT